MSLDARAPLSPAAPNAAPSLPHPFDPSDYPEGTERLASLQRSLAGSLPPLIVATTTRSGSTMMFKKVAAGSAEARFGERAEEALPCFRDWAWRLDETPLIGGVVYKTHDLADYLSRDVGAKVVFTFRQATDVALSIAERRRLRGEVWFERHVYNLRGRGGYEDFLSADSLGLERLVDSWFNAEGVDVLGVRFETMWEHEREIEDFLGFPVRLRRRRASPRGPAPDGLREVLAETYGALDRKIAAMPDVFRRTASA